MEEAPKSLQQTSEDEFARLAPLFFEKIEELSNRQLKRVVCALVMHPLMNYEVYLPYPQEKELFNLGIQLYNYKFALMSLAYGKEDVVSADTIEASEDANNKTVTDVSVNNEGEVRG